MVPGLKQPPSLHTSPDPDMAVGYWLTWGFCTVPDPVSSHTTLCGFVHATWTSSISFIHQPAHNPSRHPASYFHGEEKACPSGRALLQAMILCDLMEDRFLIPEGGFFCFSGAELSVAVAAWAFVWEASLMLVALSPPITVTCSAKTITWAAVPCLIPMAYAPHPSL